MTNDVRTPEEKEGFESAFRLYQPALIAFLCRRGVDRDDARDLIQDTFVNAFRAWDTFRGESSLKTWLINIALNVWRNKRRWEATLKRGRQTVSLETAGGALDQALAGETPDGQLLAREQRAIVSDALAKLPRQQRRCLVLHLEQRKYREIAEEMGISIGAVKSQIFDGRKRLRRLFDQQPPGRGVR